MRVLEDWLRQDRHHKDLQLVVSLSASTLFTGVLALAFRSGFIVSFALNVMMLAGFVLFKAVASKDVPVTSTSTEAQGPLVPFVDLAPLPSTQVDRHELISNESDEEFLRRSLAELAGPKRIRPRRGSSLQLIPDQDELLRKAVLQAKLRDRRRQTQVPDSEAS